jgi:beta-glucosidase
MVKKIEKLITQMTLQEKASLCSGKNFWFLKGIKRLNIPSIMVTDGPHGLRKQTGGGNLDDFTNSVPATCFPTASALAATWNRDLIFLVGDALAEECKQEKVAVILGPGANIKRSPLCGRNFEYFSEDPYLTGEIAKSHINGVQSKGIGTSLKHFAVNNQEFRRMTINAVVDQRALREIYLAGFEIAVKKSQPWTVMCAYNKVNGIYCCENEFLLTEVLREDWSYKGLVVTDWGAMNQRVEGLIAGTELEMPGVENGNEAKIISAVRSGQLDEGTLDGSVERILELIFKAGDMLSQEYQYDPIEHHKLARKVAGEGCVLLKNDSSALPIKKTSKIALIGQFARFPRYQGGGSSQMNPTQLDNIYNEVVSLVSPENVTYAPGYEMKGDEIDQGLIQEAIQVAKSAEVVVICVGLPEVFEVEGIDRKHMKLPQTHNALIKAVAKEHSKVIVVLSNGSPVEMPWVDQVAAILEGYLGGQAGAGAIADILFGDINPSGKLAETFPIKLEDNPSNQFFPRGPRTVEYRESIFVGYRYFDSVEKRVLFPFGHGLSYTTFEYRDIKLDQTTVKKNGSLTVKFKLKNTGAVSGKEIVQLYLRDVESTLPRPNKELKGFAKIALDPGEETDMEISLKYRDFAFFDPSISAWRVEAGLFEILLGASSADIRLTGKVEAEASHPKPLNADSIPSYNFPNSQSLDLGEFESLLGEKVPNNEREEKGIFTINTPIYDMRDSFIGKLLSSFMKKQLMEMIKGQEDTPMGVMMRAMAKEAPLRSLLMTGNEFLTREILDALLVMLNGKFFKGISSLTKAIRKNKKKS